MHVKSESKICTWTEADLPARSVPEMCTWNEADLNAKFVPGPKLLVFHVCTWTEADPPALVCALAEADLSAKSLPTWNLYPRAKAVPGLKLTLEARLAALSVSPSATGVILNMSATTDCESTGRLRSYIAPASFNLYLTVWKITLLYISDHSWSLVIVIVVVADIQKHYSKTAS